MTLYALWECAHTSTEKKWTTGCEWKTVCKNCGATISSGTTHGPFSYGAWEYDSTGQHKRVKECNYGDYSTTEYASHKATTRYERYSASQHRKYSHCTDCDTTIGSVSYENHTFTSTTSNGQVITTCSLCGYTKNYGTDLYGQLQRQWRFHCSASQNQGSRCYSYAFLDHSVQIQLRISSDGL